MSKRVIKMSLKEMCIAKHSVLKSINEKQAKLLKSKNQKEIQDLTKDIIEENRFYDKMSINIEEFKKENNIDDRVLSLTLSDDLGTHILQASDYTVKCNECGSERPLLKIDMYRDNVKPQKCKCGGKNEFRYWLDGVYSEEEYEELKRKAIEGNGESNE